MDFCPEIQTSTDKKYTMGQLQNAYRKKIIIHSRALHYNCERELVFDLGACRGVMPFKNCVLGIDKNTTKDISVITRVGKICQFVVTKFLQNTSGIVYCELSRTDAQQDCTSNYIDQLQYGQVIPCMVTHIEPFGAFCDIGCGITALLPIDCISVSRIASPSDRISIGEIIYCAVKSRDEKNRIVLTMRELLGTWQQNANRFKCGETAIGIVRSIETYGVFVELAPNLAGLAECTKDIIVGEQVSVYIKSILPEKMKIKLIILNIPSAYTKYQPPLEYTVITGVLSNWLYSPTDCTKKIETIFY